MKLVPLNTLFDIEYGNQFDLNKMTPSENGVNFISRSSKSLGVVEIVEPIIGVQPYSAGLITVTLGGTYLLSSFIQQSDFYTAQNVKVLKPKKEMDFVEKMFYCIAISKNRFRYSSHGREANVSLDTLLVPDKPLETWQKIKYEEFEPDQTPRLNKKLDLNTDSWKEFKLSDLFEVTASKDELMNDLTEGGSTPYITSSDKNNGVTNTVEEESTNQGNTITANRGGSVGYFFYQPKPFKATPVDVRILTPKFDINVYIGLFLKVVLQKEKFRFNYSRKMGTGRLNELKVKLPSKNGQPDLEFMEDFIKTLPYSKIL